MSALPESLNERKLLGEALLEANVLIDQVVQLHSQKTTNDPALSMPHRLALEAIKINVDGLLRCQDCFQQVEGR